MKRNNILSIYYIIISIMIIILPLQLSSCSTDVSELQSTSQTQNLSKSNVSSSPSQDLEPLNDVMMQAFYWNVPVDESSLNGTWWDNLTEKATELKQSGISAIWTPGPAKGNWGIVDNGYGIYDHYDLGNYLQKGSIETRFGSRSELESMLNTMHQDPKIDVYSDVVLNHV